MLNHRRDIDGLRALAVVPVILFHARLGLFPGGYVGVDVFFVISGFLITHVLRHDIAAGRFSILGFYERRIRRLFPALFVMLACAIVAAWWLLLPDALREFGQSVSATTFFASNIFFWRESGYFQPATENLPLLHTWSLAVEEQYYVVFPLMLFVLARHGRRVVLWSLSLLAALSFAAAVWLVAHEPEQAFYLAHTRAWELFLGALIAYELAPPVRARAAREALAASGLAAIVIAVLAFDDATPFPGLAAALPCLGAAAIIHAGSSGESLVARLLGTRLMVGIGLISYSLYLWHWPVFVLQRQYTIVPPSTAAIAVAIAGVFVAAGASWRYVERPFRGRNAVFGRGALFAGAAGLLVLFGGVGLSAHLRNGFPGRFPADVLAIAANTPGDLVLRDRCFGLSAARFAKGEMCRLGPPSAAPEFMVWGDSHSLAMLATLTADAEARGHAGVYLGASGCPPLLGVALGNRASVLRQECIDTAAQAQAVLAATPSITTVLLIARWAFYVEAHNFAGVGDDAILLTDEAAPRPSPAHNYDVIERGLRRTLTALAPLGRRVILVESVPEVAFNVPGALTQAAILGRQVELGPSVAVFHARQARTEALFEQLRGEYPRLETLPVADALCDAVQCRVVENGQPLYYDDNHLSARGVRLLRGKFAAILRWPPVAGANLP